MHHQLREFRYNGRARLGKLPSLIILMHIVHGSSLYPSQLAFNAQKSRVAFRARRRTVEPSLSCIPIDDLLHIVIHRIPRRSSPAAARVGQLQPVTSSANPVAAVSLQQRAR